MANLTYFSRIKKAIGRYQATADKIFAKGLAAANVIEQKTKPECLQQELIPVIKQFGGSLIGPQVEATGEINDAFNELERRFRSWIAKPIDTGIATTLAACASAGLTLSPAEIQCMGLAHKDSYLTLKLLNATSKSGGFCFALPDAGAYLRILREAQRYCVSAVENFAGSGYDENGRFPGEMFVFPEFHALAAVNAMMFQRRTDTSLDILRELFTKTEEVGELTLTMDGQARLATIKAAKPEELQERVSAAMKSDPGIEDLLQLAGYGSQVETYYREQRAAKAKEAETVTVEES